MGWFSKHIMGGDEPADAEAEILGYIDLDTERADNDRNLTKTRLTNMQTQLVEQCGSDIDLQVLGVLMMKYGADIRTEVKDAIIAAAKNDEWAKENLERRILIDDFICQLENYDGIPTKETIDHEVRFGVTNTDWFNSRMSSKIAIMSLYYIHKYYGNRPWYKDSTVIFSGGGYAILIGLTEAGQGNAMNVIQEVEPLFEIPVFFCDGEEMQYVPNNDTVNRVKFNGDLRIPYDAKTTKS